MPNRLRLICCSFVVLALTTAVVASQGCGSSSSSSGNFLTSCQAGCNKEAACQDASSPSVISLCMSLCASENSMMTTQPCSNLASLVSMSNACIAMPSCAGFEACLAALPDCAGGGGASGSNGSGGSSGSGGGSGTAGCSTCTKSHACCLATDIKFNIPDGQGCDAYTEAQCNSMSGSAQTQYIATCSNELLAGQTLGVTDCN